jgi:hypothetical protein
MTYQGTVQNGVVVLTGGQILPEGSIVQVLPQPAQPIAVEEDARTIWQKLADLGREAEAEDARQRPDAADSAQPNGEPTIGEKLAALGQWAESHPCELPSDLAENHDYYLHGQPKRRP